MNTYFFKTQFLDQEVVETLFRQRGNWEPYEKGMQAVTYKYVDGKYVFRFPWIWKIQTDITNVVATAKETITEKNNLYNNLLKRFPKIAKKYMMEQHDLKVATAKVEDYKHLFTKNRVWILKPIGGYSGHGIRIITSYKQFESAFKKLPSVLMKPSLTKKTTNVPYKEWVLSEYITNPLLFQGKKFHLRMYFMYTCENKGYLSKMALITTAAKKFSTGNYGNSNIHNSHVNKTAKFHFFPNAFLEEYGENKEIKKKIVNLYKQLLELFQHVLKLIRAGCFPEAKKCYETFGVDIMITDDFKVKLIEVNDKIGVIPYGIDIPVSKILTQILVGGALEHVVDKWVPPKNKQPSENLYLALQKE
jgi:hypothetical protein